MNVARKGPMVLKISENGLWYFFLLEYQVLFIKSTGWKVTKDVDPILGAKSQQTQ